MSIKITIPNSSSDVLTFGSGNTPTAAQIAGIDSGSSNGQLALYTTASGTSTERVRVDASGNVGIGTNAPTATLTVNGPSQFAGGGVFPSSGTGIEVVGTASGGTNYIQAYNRTASSWQDLSIGANLLTINTGGTERARYTGASYFFGLTTSGSSAAAAQFYTASSVNCLSARVSDNALAPIALYNAADSVICYVSGGGSIFAVSTSITAISDVRHKENIRDLDTGLAQVLALRPRRFDWKEGRGNGKKDNVGFIAQEVEAVLPDVVADWKEDLSKDEAWKGLATGDMIPTLVKAIQEQQAIITSLTDRLTALENK